MTSAPRKSHLVFQDIARFRTQLFDQLMKPYDLTTSQATVLGSLFQKDEQIQSELAETLKIGTVTIGGLVDRLEARGLVERRSMPGDRRAKRVCLTEAAYPLGRVMKKCGAQMEALALQGFSETEAQQLEAQIERVRENLLAALEARKSITEDS